MDSDLDLDLLNILVMWENRQETMDCILSQVNKLENSQQNLDNSGKLENNSLADWLAYIEAKRNAMDLSASSWVNLANILLMKENNLENCVENSNYIVLLNLTLIKKIILPW